MRFPYGIALVTLLAISGCQSTGDTRAADSGPGRRPALDSVEAGLWLQSDRMEHEVGRSGRVIDDPQLDEYLQSILCRLSSRYCDEVRIQVVRSAGFNASMLPNGHMVVWSGMLLRAENEAQLAYVLGHELSHYVERHSIKRWHELRNATDAAAFFQVLTIGAGIGIVGQLGNLFALSSVYGFSREQESEADTHGFGMLAAAGYDTQEAAKIWAGLLEEKQALNKPEQSVFFASHPSTEDRLSSLSALAQSTRAKLAVPVTGAARHQQVIRAHRSNWFDDELAKREFPSALLVLERMAKGGADQAEVDFFRGEIYRLRRDAGDDALAIDAYERALAAGIPLPVAHRSLAMVRWRAGDKAGARSEFQRYLRAAPDAGDAAMINSYINKLEQ